MKFTEVRQANGYIRCLECHRLEHKDGCYCCEACGGYSCERCNVITSGFWGTICHECDGEPAPVFYTQRVGSRQEGPQ